MSLGISKAILKLPPVLRTPHLIPLVQTDRLTLSSPSPLILLPPSLAAKPELLPSGFALYPTFFTPKEQEILLESALLALDKMGGVRRNAEGKKMKRTTAETVKDRATKPHLQGWFNDEKNYVFDDNHFDGVIKGFRETSVSKGFPDVKGAQTSFHPSPMELLSRLDYVIQDREDGKDSEILMHALHLSSLGKIDPHVDGTDTMGSSIVAVSLGGARVLRLEKDRPLEEGEEDHAPIDVLLQSGSVYVQTGDLRYNYKHSIPATRFFGNRRIELGQRVSIILRDKYLPDPASTPPSLYDPTASTALIPSPSHTEFYTPLSLRDEAVLTGEDFRLVDTLPISYVDERGGKLYIPRSERNDERRTARERTNQDLIKRGMEKRRYGKR